jgi:hypothetical protein
MRTARSSLLVSLAAPLALLLSSTPSRGDDLVQQEATGQAAILNGDKPAAREKAIQDALRQAVQMAVGTQVTSNTEVQDFQTKLDTVLNHSSGFVRKYDILKEGLDGDVVQVTIRAQVGMGELNKDLEAVGLLLSRKNMPRTMVLIAEQNIGMDAPHAVWLRGPAMMAALTATDLRIGETVLIDELKNAGFGQIIDPEVATTKAATVSGLTTEVTGTQARKIGSLTGAEVIIIGQVKAISRGEVDFGGNGRSGFKSCTASISGKAVTTDNGDILGTSESTQQHMGRDDQSCGKEAIKKATKVFAADLAKKIIARWKKDVSGGNEVHVTVKGITSIKQAGEFRSALTTFVRGVKDVKQRSYQAGVAELDVTLVGSTDQFAEEIETKKLGKFSVSVKGVSSNTVDVELGK